MVPQWTPAHEEPTTEAAAAAEVTLRRM